MYLIYMETGWMFYSFLGLCRSNKKGKRDDILFRFFFNLPTINFNNFSVQPNAQFFLIKLQFILVFIHNAAIDLQAHVYEERSPPVEHLVHKRCFSPASWQITVSRQLRKTDSSSTSSFNKRLCLKGIWKKTKKLPFAVKLETPGEPWAQTETNKQKTVMGRSLSRVVPTVRPES